MCNFCVAIGLFQYQRHLGLLTGLVEASAQHWFSEVCCRIFVGTFMLFVAPGGFRY